MTDDPWVFDLFCCEGGATRGYQDAGFKVVGMDINPQPRYCGDEFIQAPIFIKTDQGEWVATVEALEVLARPNVVVRHASPPCQAYTNAQKIQRNEHPDLVGPTRQLLASSDLPYVIENVPGSPLLDPIELCGAMFGLGTYRHRLFESNVPITAPDHPEHVAKTTKMGRKPKPGEFMHVVGNFSGVEQAKKAMGIDWMNRDGLREAIPPAYTRYIGAQMLAYLSQKEAA